MPGHPKSQTKKSQIHSKKQEEALTDAKECKEEEGEAGWEWVAQVTHWRWFLWSCGWFENTAAEEEIAREDRRKKRDEHAEVMTVWKRAEALRLERNKTWRQTFKDDLGAWEVERDLAKLEKFAGISPSLGSLSHNCPSPHSRTPGKRQTCLGLVWWVGMVMVRMRAQHLMVRVMTEISHNYLWLSVDVTEQLQ